MMYIANSSEQKYGGGFSFIDNLHKAIPDLIGTYQESDVYFIPSASMVQRDEVRQAKDDGKKIILRCDNAILNSRNRGTGMTRMKDFAEWANLVIFQSEWARGYLKPYLGKDGKVIINGTDLNLFNSKGREYHDKNDKTIYAYSRFNRDESKNWNVARYEYSKIQLQDPKAILWIIGAFSPELIEYGFDFYMDENYKFWGVQPKEMMASLYKQIDVMIIPYYNDACSNTLIESLVSGCKIFPNHFLKTGGSAEIINKFNEFGEEYFSLERMGKEYRVLLS